VRGLREDALDTDSFYGNRASFLSEYSLGGDDGVQVFIKEHGRKSSKDSTSSFLSRRKTQQLSAPKRPETKVGAFLPFISCADLT
jgi:serine/arginine repetitive matrix protein 2